ncbi:hypothetical protein T492DRAFT_856886 [Pavlovales sp. CCMP2436]|nr:hypothetical protein T492DRAFT_856886 [Pavlovales sp. CCMP2436]
MYIVPRASLARLLWKLGLFIPHCIIMQGRRAGVRVTIVISEGSLGSPLCLTRGATCYEDGEGRAPCTISLPIGLCGAQMLVQCVHCALCCPTDACEALQALEGEALTSPLPAVRVAAGELNVTFGVDSNQDVLETALDISRRFAKCSQRRQEEGLAARKSAEPSEWQGWKIEVQTRESALAELKQTGRKVCRRGLTVQVNVSPATSIFEHPELRLAPRATPDERKAAAKLQRDEPERLAAAKLKRDELERLAASHLKRAEPERLAAAKLKRDEPERLATAKLKRAEPERHAATVPAGAAATPVAASATGDGTTSSSIPVSAGASAGAGAGAWARYAAARGNFAAVWFVWCLFAVACARGGVRAADDDLGALWPVAAALFNSGEYAQAVIQVDRCLALLGHPDTPNSPEPYMREVRRAALARLQEAQGAPGAGYSPREEVGALEGPPPGDAPHGPVASATPCDAERGGVQQACVAAGEPPADILAAAAACAAIPPGDASSHSGASLGVCAHASEGTNAQLYDWAQAQLCAGAVHIELRDARALDDDERAIARWMFQPLLDDGRLTLKEDPACEIGQSEWAFGGAQAASTGRGKCGPQWLHTLPDSPKGPGAASDASHERFWRACAARNTRHAWVALVRAPEETLQPTRAAAQARAEAVQNPGLPPVGALLETLARAACADAAKLAVSDAVVGVRLPFVELAEFGGGTAEAAAQSAAGECAEHDPQGLAARAQPAPAEPALAARCNAHLCTCGHLNADTHPAGGLGFHRPSVPPCRLSHSALGLVLGSLPPLPTLSPLAAAVTCPPRYAHGPLMLR